jgi:hypothetical protein
MISVFVNGLLPDFFAISNSSTLQNVSCGSTPTANRSPAHGALGDDD